MHRGLRAALGIIVAASTGLPTTTASADTNFGCSQPSFAAPAYVLTAGIPSALALQDMDGNGRLDAVVTNLTGGTSGAAAGIVSLLLGQGDGLFQPRKDVTSISPFGVTVADVNGDNRPDVLVPTYQGASVLTFSVDSAGALAPQGNLPTGVNSAPFRVANGDLNGDGRNDLAVVFSPTQGVSVFLNGGSGLFGPPTEYLPGSASNSVALADVNGDGRLDLITAGLGVFVALGTGTGTFLSGTQYAAGPTPYALSVADFDGDRRPDILVANLGSANTVSVLRNAGNGTFQPAVAYATGTGPNATAVGDFNGDGHLDIATANFDASVSVLLGRGDGTFQPHVDYYVGAAPNGIAVGDLNGDGRPDIAAVTEGLSPVTGGGAFVTLMNTCGLAVPAPHSLAFNGQTFAETRGNDLNLTGNWTIEAWFKDEDPDGFNHDFRELLMKGDHNADPESPYYLLIGRNSILAGIRTNGQDYPIVRNLVDGLDPHQWHHVAVTFDATINTLNLWLDGTHIAYFTTPTHSVVGNSAPVYIGTAGPTSGKFWLGKLDDVRIWDRARKGSEISATFRTQFVTPQSGLIANWQFDEESGTQAADSTGRGHTLALHAGTTFVTDVHH